MIAATRKILFILAIQLLLNITNEVNTSVISNPAEKVKKLVPEAIKNRIYEVTNSAMSFLKDNVTLNCLGFSTKFFSKAIDALLTDVTKAQDVRFYFASQKKPNYTTVTILNDKFTLKKTDFSPYRDTVVISHGFMSSGKEKWLKEMKNAFLKYDDVNVIVVDWQKGSNTWNYIAAATSTKIVGAEIAKLFEHMRNDVISKGVDLDLLGKIHFVGHSLGAHIVARAAHIIKETQKEAKQAWIVDRITGLDPAQPCFSTADESLKLDETDANYVDVIHTNARHIIYLGLGLPQRLGYIDFYPNGGQIQPGCSEIDTSIWAFLSLPKKIIQASVCSHGRSHQFLIESIIDTQAGNCSFIGHRWNLGYNDTTNILLQKTCSEDVCPQMGIASINSFPRNKGIFFTPTGHSAPYCTVKDSDIELIEKQLKTDESLTRMVSYIGK